MYSVSVKNIFRLLLYFSFLLLSVSAIAQNPYAMAISPYIGHVYDKASGQALAGARVIITNTDSNNVILNTTSGSDGSYYLYYGIANIKISVSLSGYQDAEVSYNRSQLKAFEKKFPPINLEKKYNPDANPNPNPTPTPSPPVNQPVPEPKDVFIMKRLTEIKALPTPGAYELLYFLNPGLRGKTSLMSNERIILPIMPRVNSEITSENKNDFRTSKNTDRTIENNLKDSIYKVARILDDDISNYKINYNGVPADSVKLLRTYLQQDLMGYMDNIRSTSKQKAEEMIFLISELGTKNQDIISKRKITHEDYENIKLLWEDLSVLLINTRYHLFFHIKNRILGENKGNGFFVRPSAHPGTASDNEEIGQKDYYQMPEVFFIQPLQVNKKRALPFDDVAVFGFVIWGKGITRTEDLGTRDQQDRYTVTYFKPAFANNKDRQITCNRRANVAIANLTRAKFSVKVYDNVEKRYVTVRDLPVDTYARFSSREYDALVIPDYKEVTFIILEIE